MRQCDESKGRDFGGAKRARPGGPTFSGEDEIDMIEFMKANPVHYAKEHVHYVDKAKKDNLWDRLEGQGKMVGSRANPQGRQAHFRPEVRLRQELSDD